MLQVLELYMGRRVQSGLSLHTVQSQNKEQLKTSTSVQVRHSAKKELMPNHSQNLSPPELTSEGGWCVLFFI